MHYEVWKWIDSGDVEFRLHAVSKAADQAHGCCEPASGCSAARTSCASTARSAGESAD